MDNNKEETNRMPRLSEVLDRHKSTGQSKTPSIWKRLFQRKRLARASTPKPEDVIDLTGDVEARQEESVAVDAAEDENLQRAIHESLKGQTPSTVKVVGGGSWDATTTVAVAAAAAAPATDAMADDSEEEDRKPAAKPFPLQAGEEDSKPAAKPSGPSASTQAAAAAAPDAAEDAPTSVPTEAEKEAARQLEENVVEVLQQFPDCACMVVGCKSFDWTATG